MKYKMRLKPLIIIFWLLSPSLTTASGKLVLRATGSQVAYTIINDQLADYNGDVIEVPDCSHDEFGPHITQVFNKFLNRYVFRFHIHRDHDSDRCKKFDRQRTEIKVYRKSPEWLRAIEGSQFKYRWKFKLDKLFQGSRHFTHLHQIKAVGGSEASMPLITLSARKGRRGKPDMFELNYAKNSKQRKMKLVKLGPFLGQWAEAIEQISFGENGKYFIKIKSLKTGKQLFNYRNDSIRMWKNEADFLRPKWGIYRSLKDKEMLRDEMVDFADVEIQSN